MQKGRYAEVVARVLGKKTKTNYYTEDNNNLVKDTISLNGDDWTFSQHVVIDTKPSVEDYQKTVSNYLAWQISSLLRGHGDNNLLGK